MVRIQSDRWYSRENQKSLRSRAPSNSSGNRRLVSLVFLLAIVVLLMQRASDPKYVRQAFNALGMELDRQVAASTHWTAEQQQQQSAPLAELIVTPAVPSPWRSVCSDLSRRMLESASVEQLDALAKFWFEKVPRHRLDAGELIRLEGLSAGSLVEKLKADLDPTVAASSDWAELLDRFEMQWQILVKAYLEQNSGTQPADSVDRVKQGETEGESGSPQDSFKQNLSPEFQEELTVQLDKRLLEILRDGGPWTTSELVGFGRLLQRGLDYQLGAQDPPLIATQQLNGEYAKFRGNWVRYRGTVRRIDPADRAVPLLPNQARYSVLWIRGADQSNQPVAVYSAHDLVRQLQQTLANGEYPEIEVIGLVGKKLAYAAEVGVQLAPTLFAGSMIQFAAEQPLRPSTAASNALSSQLKLVTSLAVVLGLVAIWSIWRQVHQRKRTSRINLLIMFAGSLCLSAGNVQPAYCQVPPWAEPPSPSKIKTQVVQQRLQPLIEPGQLDRLEMLLDGSTTDLPELVLRTLHALNQVRWPDLTTPPVVDEIDLSQGYTLRQQTLQGRVRSVQRLALDAKQQEWFSAQNTPAIYRLQVESADVSAASSPPPLSNIFCLNVPQMWKTTAQLNQPIQLTAFSLMHSTDGGAAGLVCSFAQRPAWKIDAVEANELGNLQPSLPARWMALGKLGWDLAWFDLLAGQNQKRLTQAETGPLLKMLELAHQFPDQMATIEPGPIKPLEAMKQPLDHIAAAIEWQVRLISGSVVDLEHAGQSTRYFQLDGFVYLPNQTVNYVHPESGQTLTFRNEFPCTILTTVDNPFVPRERIAAGQLHWEIGQTARIQGLFMRLWSYESQGLSTPTATARQVAPLIVAGRLTATTLQQPVSSQSLWLTLVLGLAALAITAFFLRSAYQLTVRQRRYIKRS